MMKVSRREFVKIGALSSAALATSPSTLLAQQSKPKVDVWVFKGPDNQVLMKQCMETLFANGGLAGNVKKIAIKPNAMFNRTPEEAAATHPDVVEGFLKAAADKGFTDILLPERFASSAGKNELPERNGIGPVLSKYKVKLIPTKSADSNFKTITIEGAKSLKTVDVCSELLEADAVVNMPVAKHHSGAKLTMAMKNWMGVVKDPRWWHQNDLPQCIADFCLFLKPTWTIIDATRCMTSKGPNGPSPDMIYPQQIILSKDQVAADVVAAQLFHDDPFAVVKYLAIAKDMNIGETDVANMNIRRIEC
ncbi:MAG: DUF362 domain-containing protein [Kiritimatiellales bacterium]